MNLVYVISVMKLSLCIAKWYYIINESGNPVSPLIRYLVRQ